MDSTATLTREPGQDFDPSFLDPLETSVNSQLPASYRDHRMAHHAEEAEAALDLYSALDNSEGTHRSENFLQCRSWAWFARHRETGAVKVVSNACHLRWCPICAEAKSGLISGNVKEWLEHIHKPKFFTLTVMGSNEPLRDQVERLYKQFRAFRTHKFIKKHIRGGVWFFQLTWRPKSKQWHPHLHCVLDADYISHRTLSAEWLATTGNSFIVDIRAVKDTHKAATDVARYSSRPCSLSHFKNLDKTEIFSVFHGKRLCGSFGTGHKVLLRPKRQDDRLEWQRLPAWSVVINNRFDGGCFQAIIKAWATNSPLNFEDVREIIKEDAGEKTIESYRLHPAENYQLAFEEFR